MIGVNEQLRQVATPINQSYLEKIDFQISELEKKLSGLKELKELFIKEPNLKRALELIVNHGVY